MSSIRVRVRLFAGYREFAGTGDVELEVPSPATARAVVERLRSRGAGWQRIPPEPTIAVNMSYSELDHPLADGDEVALIPPVSGG